MMHDALARGFRSWCEGMSRVSKSGVVVLATHFQNHVFVVIRIYWHRLAAVGVNSKG